MPDYIELARTLLIGLAAGAMVYLTVRVPAISAFARRGDSRTIARWIDRIFYGALIAFFILYAALDLGKYEAFNIYGLDFALFDQAIWNSLHGRLFQNTLVPDAPLILSQHFSVTLLALVPLYALYASPRILVLLPVATVVLTAVLLYWFARQQVGRGLAFVIAALYVLSPGIQIIALGQFYEIMLAMPLLMLATIFLLRRRYRAFWITLGVLFLSKEDIPLIAVGFGLYLFFIQRKYVWGVALSVFSLVWFAALVQYVLPFFQGGENFYYFGSGIYGAGQYAYLGTGFAEIVRTVLTRPDIVLQHLLVPGKIDSALKLIVPLSLMPFAGAEVSALALPTLGYTLVSDRETQYIVGSHHYSAVFPFLLLGVVVGVRRLKGGISSGPSRQAFQAALGAFLLVTSAANYYLYAPGPLSQNFYPPRYTPTAHAALGNSLASMIPSDAAVFSQMELLPQVAERANVYVMPGIPCLAKADYLFADLRRPWYGYYQTDWDHALSASFFETVASQDGFVLKKYRPLAQLDHPAQVQFGEGVTALGYTLPLTETVYGGAKLQPVLAWKIDQAAPKRYAVELHVVDAQNHLWAKQEREPCRGISVEQREVGAIVNEDFVLNLPPTMPAGDYEITVALYDKDREAYLPVHAVAEAESRTEAVLASVRVEKNRNSFAASQLPIEQPLFVDMGEMRLLGYVPPRQTISPGELLQVGLYWRARGKPGGDYVVAVQLRDAADNVAYEQTARPGQNAYPTTLWNVGEVLLDWHDFTLPTDLADGEYQIVAVLRDSASQQILGQTPISKISVAK